MRVEIATQPWGVVWIVSGTAPTQVFRPAAGVTVQLRTVSLVDFSVGVNATTYSAIQGGTSSTSNIVTDADGVLPRFIDEGTYYMTIGSVSRYIQASAGSSGGGGGANASDVVKGIARLSLAAAVPSDPIVVGTNDTRMTNQRVPTDGSVTTAKVNDALKPSAGAAAGTEALRALGSTATTAAAGNDARLSDARAPTGAAGGALGGTYPNPTIGGIADIATIPVVLEYTGSAYPTRPDGPNVVFFKGSVAPVIGGTGNAIDGKDLWIDTTA